VVSTENLANEPVVFPLRDGRGTIALHAGGFRHPAGFGTERFTEYSDLTHLATGPRSIRIGARDGVVAIPRSYFRDPAAGDALVRSLIDRIAREPSGTVQLARMAEIEETLRQPSAPWVARFLWLACLAVFGLGIWLGPILSHAGFFGSKLATSGEPWRLFTANLLHADPIHLTLNVLGLALLGGLVERALGAARTVLVIGLSALGATLAGVVMGYDWMVGASGIVAGFFGALVWLELRLPERLPAQWRIPRRLLWIVLALQLILDFSLPFIAAAAHVGGFAAGMLAAALSAGPGLRREPLAPALAVASGLLVVIAAASVVSAARLVAGGAAMEHHAARLLQLDDLQPQVLNDAAWLIATGRKPTSGALAHAAELAERAVRETERADPNLLDTLAEVEFQSGHRDEAVDTIDEAIALAPEVDYFREQRRRFRGERAADDRPEPPIPSLAPAPEREPRDEPMPSPFEDQDNPGVEI
jgi:membrane associated rhomboid family serine protease